MHVVWATQLPPRSFSCSLFLAGPTPRTSDQTSWRAQALSLLESWGWEGVVFVPEPEDQVWTTDYDTQIQWEEDGLHMADVVVFWVPRDLDGMPGFTTNIEWGCWHDSGKVVLGFPKQAPKMKYMHAYAKKLGIPTAHTLEQTLRLATARAAQGAMRHEGERWVPLHIWRTKEFQSWYHAHLGAGHRLDHARLESQLWGGKGRQDLFGWMLRPSVHIPSEQRSKSGEAFFARPDTASVLAYSQAERLEDTMVVLVREFRTAATTDDGMIWELPGGSDPGGGEAREVARQELLEETGVALPASRLLSYPARQTAGTLLSHKAALFGVELTPQELDMFRDQQGVVHGSNQAERTQVQVVTLGEILSHQLLDWTNLGMILSVLVSATMPQEG